MAVRNTEQTILVLLIVCTEMDMYMKCHKGENKAQKNHYLLIPDAFYFML